MPVKAPEIVDNQKTEASRSPQGELYGAERSKSQETEVDANVTVSDNQVDIVISKEYHQTEVNVISDNHGNIGVSVNEQTVIQQPVVKVSALSLKSIRAKKELELATKANAKEEAHLPTEAFNETDLLLQWTKYAQRLSDRGHKIMESLMLINDPTLDGTTVVHELPNESAKIDFESGKHELVGY